MMFRWLRRLISPPAERRPTTGLVLYHFPSCPYCAVVRGAVRSLALDLPMKDIRRDDEAYRELVRGGGKKQVPCLRVEEEGGDVRWLYESMDIVAYLRKRYA